MKSSDAIDVICQHSKDGTVMPIKIRIQDDDGLYNEYMIKSYMDISSDKVLLPNEAIVTTNILRFDCIIEVFCVEKKIRLHYNKQQSTWNMYF